ncbi:MAG: cupin [Microvirga sp.]|jgi:gentisate 1,2-dioxygenase|nr:cupin [Microvirga sp.]
MSTQLGTLEELPTDYREAMDGARVSPLWPMMRNVLPHGQPNPVTKPAVWSFDKIRPLLLRAGELTPVERAERRVLVLNDPGRGKGAMQVTSSIYVGLQLLLPGEKAPAHKHTPSAARIVVEGEGAFTIVDGEKCAMERGDLILTPGGMWHDHGHGGTGPVIWLDALDLPLFVFLEGSYAEEGELQAPRNRPDASQVEYKQAGLVPSRNGGERPRYPLLRFPWKHTETALRSLAEHAGHGEPVELDYVNPETGDSCLPTLGFAAMMLRRGETARPPRRSSSGVFHAVEGAGRSTVNGESFSWKRGDTFSAPVFAKIEHTADGEAFLIRIHDAPLQQKLGFYEERA